MIAITNNSTTYGAITDPIWETVNEVPSPVFLISVGYNSDMYSKLTENTALTQNFPSKAINNKKFALSENNSNIFSNINT